MLMPNAQVIMVCLGNNVVFRKRGEVRQGVGDGVKRGEGGMTQEGWVGKGAGRPSRPLPNS